MYVLREKFKTQDRPGLRLALSICKDNKFVLSEDLPRQARTQERRYEQRTQSLCVSEDIQTLKLDKMLDD